MALEWGRGREAIGAVLRCDLMSPQVGIAAALLSSVTLSDHQRLSGFQGLWLITDRPASGRVKQGKWAFGAATGND